MVNKALHVIVNPFLNNYWQLYETTLSFSLHSLALRHDPNYNVESLVVHINTAISLILFVKSGLHIVPGGVLSPQQKRTPQNCMTNDADKVWPNGNIPYAFNANISKCILPVCLLVICTCTHAFAFSESLNSVPFSWFKRTLEIPLGSCAISWLCKLLQRLDHAFISLQVCSFSVGTVSCPRP